MKGKMTMQTKLVETDSSQYLRRLVRELNRRFRNGEAVYLNGGQRVYRCAYCGRGPLAKPTLFLRGLGNYFYSIGPFYNAHGQEIVAARTK